MKKSLILLAFAVMMVTGVYAADIGITVNTEPFHNTIVRILNPSTGAEITSVYPIANGSGQATTTFSTTFSELSFLVIVKHPLDKNIVDEERFDSVDVSSGSVFLDLVDAPAELVHEETVTPQVDEAEVTEEIIETPETAPQSNSLTGFFVSESGSISSNVYYLSGALILLIVIFLVAMKGRAMMAIKTPLSLDEELKEAQRKIREAEAEIKEIKKKQGDSEVDEAEKQFLAAKERLERLRGHKEALKDQLKENKKVEKEVKKQIQVKTPDEEAYDKFQESS